MVRTGVEMSEGLRSSALRGMKSAISDPSPPHPSPPRRTCSSMTQMRPAAPIWASNSAGMGLLSNGSSQTTQKFGRRTSDNDLNASI